ncbi:MAG: hypothetical protein HY424_00060 [Candidatus Levybacteria bacterium]|nr:hypothetical protein [Candidatus Levybacteria bacterium]
MEELKLRWEATFNRIYYSLKLAGNSLDRREMLRILTENTHKKIDSSLEAVIKYKAAQDYIFQNWLGSQHSVDAQALIDLHKIIGDGKVRIPKAGLQYLLDYLQARPLTSERSDGGRAKSENPIIRAAIINIEIEKMQLFSEHVLEIANLSSLLFLYKYGYDMRGFLAYEAEWDEENEDEYRENRRRAVETTSLTLWLEYFASSMLKQIERIRQSIEKSKSSVLGLRESFWKLNERQKSILSLLDQPQITITNRQVQKRYKISQITASRDLAKLESLGFLFSHGKGRSVYYTKI